MSLRRALGAWLHWWTRDEIVMWIWLFVLFCLAFCVSVTIAGYHLSSFYLLPVWATLLLGPCIPAFRHPLIVICVSMMAFTMTEWWMQTYPAECRTHWKTRLLYDTTWTPQRFGLALSLYGKELLPGLTRNELQTWLVVNGIGDEGFQLDEHEDGDHSADEFRGCYLPHGGEPAALNDSAASLLHRRLAVVAVSALPESQNDVAPVGASTTPVALLVWGTSTRPSGDGVYRITSIQPGPDNGNYRIFENKQRGRYLFYWKPEEYWCIGTDYTRNTGLIFGGGTLWPTYNMAWREFNYESNKFEDAPGIIVTSIDDDAAAQSEAIGIQRPSQSPQSADKFTSGEELPHSSQTAAPEEIGDSLAAPALTIHAPALAEVPSFNLRAYCLCHQFDEFRTWDTVYILFQPPEELPLNWALRGHCYPWTCTFTEAQPTGRWGFYVVLFLTMVGNVAHCIGCGRWTETLGAGQFRWWWIWFWAMFFPVWGVMFVTRIKGTTVQDYVQTVWDGSSSLVMGTETTLVTIVIVLVAMLAYSGRDRIYKVLGVDDRKVVHWLNLSTSARDRQRKAIQLCIWRVDAAAWQTMTDFASWEMSGVQSVASGKWEQDHGSPSRQERAPLFGCGGRWSRNNNNNTRYSPLETFNSDASTDERQLPFAAGRKPNLFVRVAYGDNEVHNTRVQRLSSSIHHHSSVYVQENMRLTATGKSESMLNIELADQGLVGYTESGRVAVSEATILHECRRAQSNFDELARCGRTQATETSVAAEQVRRMFGGVQAEEWGIAGDHEDEQDERVGMYLVGFRPHELSQGGVIWLAFADVSESDVEGSCVIF